MDDPPTSALKSKNLLEESGENPELCRNGKLHKVSPVY